MAAASLPGPGGCGAGPGQDAAPSPGSPRRGTGTRGGCWLSDAVLLGSALLPPLPPRPASALGEICKIRELTGPGAPCGGRGASPGSCGSAAGCGMRLHRLERRRQRLARGLGGPKVLLGAPGSSHPPATAVLSGSHLRRGIGMGKYYSDCCKPLPARNRWLWHWPRLGGPHWSLCPAASVPAVLSPHAGTLPTWRCQSSSRRCSIPEDAPYCC